MERCTDLSWDGIDDDVEHTTSYILARLSLLCLHTGTAGAFCTLMYLASMYTQLTFWLPNIQAQLMYIQYIQSILPTLVTIKNWSVIFSAAAYAFISLSNEGWFGLVSFVTVVAALVPVLHMVHYVGPSVINPYLLQQSKELRLSTGSRPSPSRTRPRFESRS